MKRPGVWRSNEIIACTKSSKNILLIDVNHFIQCNTRIILETKELYLVNPHLFPLPIQNWGNPLLQAIPDDPHLLFNKTNLLL